MGLQSSGQIKISEIQTELGSSSGSLRALSLDAGFVVPDAMSEFYGYSSGPTGQYWSGDGVNDYIHGTAGSGPGQTFALGDDFSSPYTVTMWVRPEFLGSGASLFGMMNSAGRGQGWMIFQYNYNSSAFFVRERYLDQSARERQRWWNPASNTAASGISSGRWSRTNRGNVNGDGWTMLTITHNNTVNPVAGQLKLYWNASEMTASFSDKNGNYSPFFANLHHIGDAAHLGSPTAGVYEGGMAFVRVFQSVLSPGEITSLYNHGLAPISSSTVDTTNMIYEVDMNGDVLTNPNGRWGFTNSGGTFVNY
jgi:hypothetical protein